MFLKYVQELSMGGLGLNAVPTEVWESGEVIKLDLSRNSIQELSVELSSCVSLQVKLYLLFVFPVRFCFENLSQLVGLVMI